MPTNDNTHPGMLFANGEPIAEIKDAELTEAPKEDPAKEDEPAPYFNNSPEMEFKRETYLTKRDIRRLKRVNKKTMRELKKLEKNLGTPIMGYSKPMRKREIDKKIKHHNKFLTAGKGEPAYFTNAYLCCVDLSGVNLRAACFRGATLQAVKFNGADLESTDFTGAHFIGTDLRDANLRYARLKGITVDKIFVNENTEISVPVYCPSSGSFIGWKKAFYEDPNLTDYYPTCIVKLLIPEDAKRSSAFSEKCRCDKAEILGAYDYDTGYPLKKKAIIHSMYDTSFEYHIGDTITIPNFDDNRWDECSSGFHFFVNEESAKNF